MRDPISYLQRLRDATKALRTVVTPDMARCEYCNVKVEKINNVYQDKYGVHCPNSPSLWQTHYPGWVDKDDLEEAAIELLEATEAFLDTE